VVEKHRRIIIQDPLVPHPLINQMHDLKNEISALLESWIGQKILETKFGIKIPLSSTTISIKAYMRKQQRSKTEVYEPCEICGEKRITNYCHIVPRMIGGPSAEENYLYLCPTHHHLFDGKRLSEEEWAKIDFSSKSESARAYAKKYVEPYFTGQKSRKEIYGVRLEDFGMKSPDKKRRRGSLIGGKRVSRK